MLTCHAYTEMLYSSSIQTAELAMSCAAVFTNSAMRLFLDENLEGICGAELTKL